MTKKHKGEKKPKWTRPNPAAGKHGVPDKAAHKLGKKWEAGDQTEGTHKAP